MSKDAKNWPTPDAHQPPELYQLGHLAPQTQTDGGESSMSDQTSPPPSPKRLNPNFVEWLMAVPVGWTDLKPLEMDSFHQWLQNFYGE